MKEKTGEHKCLVSMSEYNLMKNLDLNINYTITNYTPIEFYIGLGLIELKWTAVPWQWNECHSSLLSIKLFGTFLGCHLWVVVV